MSQIKAVQHKFSESASRRSSRSVGDSVQTTLMDHKTTNKQATSTFTGLILASFSALAVLGLGGVFGTQDTYATASSLSISISGNPTINIPPTASGKFSDSGNITVTVNTTHAAGYGLSLTATGSSNPTSLATNNGAGTVGFTTLAAGTKIDADTFAAAANTQYNGKWGYRYNKTGSTKSDDDKYRPSPSTSGDTLDTTNTNADNTYQLSIGARATTDTAMDSYSNTFRFVVLANATPYTLTYIDNSGEATGMPSPNPASGTSSGETATNAVSDTVPVRDGYTFKGWCSTSTSDDSCSGTTYNPDGDGTNRDITLNQQSSTNNFTLYAMWKSSAASLYDMVAAMSKGKQTLAQLRTAITVPTSADRTQDTSNSGVYEYDASVFGTSSDASNDSKIYYYRGVLENSVGSYGSDGSAVTYPNYVILQAGSSKAATDTCWRIVRTTGSGGVKMIYNGKWTGSTCANATTNAQVTTSAYNGTSSTYRQIVRVGYTYNSTYAENTAKSGTIAQIFGTNSSPTTNNTRSTIKEYIENTWYKNNMTAWTSILEPSAGYCNDRTMNTTNSWTTPLGESSTIAATYGTSSLQAYYFGAYPRNANAAQGPSLTCGNKYSQIDRSVVDLYRYNGTNGAAGSTTANYLEYPAALLTADESAFAGSGYSSSTTPYHANSYLRSGSAFWLLSPGSRSSGGYAYGFLLYSGGSLNLSSVSGSFGVRPAISLASGTSAASGTGTATDPWVVIAP